MFLFTVWRCKGCRIKLRWTKKAARMKCYNYKVKQPPNGMWKKAWKTNIKIHLQTFCMNSILMAQCKGQRQTLFVAV